MIRPLIADEAETLAASLAAMDPWRRLGFSAQGLEGYLTGGDPCLRRMVILDQGAVAGLIALRQPWLRGPYVEVLAVLPHAQGKGLGKAMLAWAAAQDGANLWACVSAFNVAARGFYQSQDFQEVVPLDDLVTQGKAEILLRRRLR